MKSLAILGSTGSIGENTLKVYEKNKINFDLIFLAAHKNLKKLLKQKKKYNPKKIFLLNENNIKNKRNVNVSSIEELYKFKDKKKIDYIISGVSGFESIKINFKLLKLCKNLLIANKETIICGGDVFLNNAKKNKCNILPIDSEHHCIDFFLKNFKFKKEDIKTIYLTASGGPFLNKKIVYNEKISNVLKHPNWKMGKKISVDSSTFANKVLELFEAKILFKIPSSKIKIIIESNSVVHSVINFNNNISFQVLHKANMEIPISNALNLKNKFLLQPESLNIKFFEPNLKKFPIVNLGYEILNKLGQSGMIYFTVINQRLVESYLKNEINYGEISKILVKTFKNKSILKKSKSKINSYDDIIKTIAEAEKIKI